MKGKWIAVFRIASAMIAIMLFDGCFYAEESSTKAPRIQNAKQWIETLEVDPNENCAELDYPSFWKRIELPDGEYEVTLIELDVTSGGFPHIKSGTGNKETGAYDQQFSKAGQKYNYVGPTYIAGYFIDAKGSRSDNSGKAIFKIRKIK
jgi:hypothetical protein